MEAVPAAVPATRSTGWARAALLMAVVIGADQLTKGLIRHAIAPGTERKVAGPLSFVHVHNRGVAFGFLGGGGIPVLIVTLAALALLVGYFAHHPERRLLWLPTGLLLGGALGNIVDRLRQGYVTDFIHVPHWPSFNVADVCITLGVLALVLVLDRGGRAAAD